MFQFKQFTVHQEKCAMKVCTDACLFGAWVAERTRSTDSNPSRILDIGSGTGLLGLMLAQETTGVIGALEIVEAAAEQSNENFERSPWKTRLHCTQADVNEYNPGHSFDLIISNPPFFEADLKSADQRKNLAKHDTGLTLERLVTNIDRLLSPTGYAAILFPYHRTAEAETLIQANQMFVTEKMLVRQSVTHGFFRTMLIFGNKQTLPVVNEMAIHDANRDYTSAFTDLLKPFYLYL